MTIARSARRTAYALTAVTAVLLTFAPPAAAAVPDVPLGDWGNVQYVVANCTTDSSMITLAAVIACVEQNESVMAWDAPASDGGSPVLDYLVQVAPSTGLGSSTPSGPYVTVATVSAATRQYTVTPGDRAAAGVPDAGTFVVNVVARNLDGSSSNNPVPLGVYPWSATNGLLPLNPGVPAQTAGLAEFTIPVVAANFPNVTAATAVEVDWRLAAGPGPWTAGGSTPVVGGVASVVLNGFPGNQGIEFRYRPTAGGALGDWSTLGPLTATLPVPDPVVLTSTLSSVSACPSEADSALMTACYDNVAQTLTWPTPSDNGVAITGYEVESTVDGVTWAPRAGLPAGTNSLIVDQAYRQAAGITAVQSYRVRLRAVSASGAGSWGTNGMGAHCATGAFTAGPCALSTLSRSGDGTTATITAKTIIAPSYPLVDTVEYGYRLPADLPAATVVAGTAPVVGVAPVTATFTLPDSTVTYVVSVRGVAGGTPGPWQDGTFAGYVPPGAPGGGSGSGSGGGDSTPSTSTTPGTSATQSAPDTTATPTASPDDLSAWVVGARMATGFKKRSGILRPKAKKNIDSFIESLSPGMTIGVYGFSPSTSNTTAANASRLRANRVAAYLRAHGVPVVHVSKGLSRKDARIAFGPGSRIQHNRTVVMLGLTPLPVTEQAPLPTDPDLELPGTARHLEDGKPLDTQTNPGSDAGGDVAGEIASVAPNYRLGVAFAHGSATLNSKSIRAGFAEFVAHAKEAGLSGPVAVYGHAGAYECKTEAACTRLSQKRASALAAELRDMGIRIARVDVVGWGQMPVATSLGQTTPHNRAAVMTAAVTWPTDSVAPALIRAAQSTKELS